MQLRIKHVIFMALIGLSIASCETNQSNEEEITKSTFNSSQSPSTRLSAKEREYLEILPPQCKGVYLNTKNLSKVNKCVTENHNLILDNQNRANGI